MLRERALTTVRTTITEILTSDLFDLFLTYLTKIRISLPEYGPTITVVASTTEIMKVEYAVPLSAYYILGDANTVVILPHEFKKYGIPSHPVPIYEFPTIARKSEQNPGE